MKTVSLIAFILHLFIFSSISYLTYTKNGFNWTLIPIAIVVPIYCLFKNLKEDNKNGRY